jgi:hypothetical protein
VRRAFSNESVRRRFERTIVLELKAKAGYFARTAPPPVRSIGSARPMFTRLGGKWTSLSRVQPGIHKLDNQLELTTDKQ